jgi:predicted ATPase
LSSAGNRRILISCSSSGQQEMAPLLIILSHYLNGHLDGFPRNYNRQRTINIYIEEPEAHLFPSSQKKIVEIISSTFKSILKSVPSSRFFVTTHSPYVLTTLNNLILASKLKNKEIKLKYNNKSIKKNQLKPYKIEDGQIFSIQELKSGLIDANYIDNVSSQIIEEFEEILNA